MIFWKSNKGHEYYTTETIFIGIYLFGLMANLEFKMCIAAERYLSVSLCIYMSLSITLYSKESLNREMFPVIWMHVCLFVFQVFPHHLPTDELYQTN